jgi:cytochrome b6-f complex iron-sulfur subunit
MADDSKPGTLEPSAPPTGANPAATPHVQPKPGADQAATARAAAATGAVPVPPAAGAAAGATAHTARPAPAPRPPAAAIPDLAGRTTNVASAGGQAARATTATPATTAAKTTAAKTTATTRDPDDTSPLLTRRAWLGLAWGAFSAASAAALAATGRFMFPNVLNEPPQQFKVGFPNEYGIGVDERWKEKYGVWLVRTVEDIDQHASGFYSLISVCTHLGCTPNYLSAENKFKCPCHGSGFRTTGVNFEGPAPRPLERARIVMADDGQILVDKSRKFQRELGQWTDPEAFLKA